LKYPISFIESIPIKPAGLMALEKRLAVELNKSKINRQKVDQMILNHYDVPRELWGEMAAKVEETLNRGGDRMTVIKRHQKKYRDKIQYVSTQTLDQNPYWFSSLFNEVYLRRFIQAMGYACNALKKDWEKSCKEIDLEMIRNVSESHLFNILFIRSCESRKILPLGSPAYHKISLTEVIETLDHMDFDSDKGIEPYLKFFKIAFGQNFSPDGTDIYDRLLNLYKVVQDGDMGFGVVGFKESLFAKEEWLFATKYKISNEAMVHVLFSLNFTDSEFGNRKYQQIPYNFFTPRQLGSIYESFLEFKLEEADRYRIFSGKQWKGAVHGSSPAKLLVQKRCPEVFKGDLYFTPLNSARKMSGSFYTPDTLVDYVVKNTLTPLCEGLSSKEILALSIIDPAMGSGHFLRGSLKFLTEKYRRCLAEETRSDVTEPLEESSCKILNACIYGVDVNPRAVKLAKMSLWLSTAMIDRKLECLDDQLKCFNSLNLGKWKSEFFGKNSQKMFDCVIGNPPYGATVGSDEGVVIEDLHRAFSGKFPDLQINDFEKVNSFALFILCGWLNLKPKGILSFVISDAFRSIMSFQKIRKWLLENRLILAYEIAPDDSFSPLIVHTGIITLGKDGRRSEIVRCSDFSSIGLANLSDNTRKTTLVSKHASADLLRIHGAPILCEVETNAKSLMLDRDESQTLGMGDHPLVGSYQGLATGKDPLYLAVLQGADLSQVNIKTGVDGLEKITKKEIYKGSIKERERENGIASGSAVYVPFVKATRSERYSYESPLYINWSAKSVAKMKSLKNSTGRISSRFQNKEIYFEPGLVSSGDSGILSVFFVEGAIPAVSTNFIRSDTDQFSTKYLCGLLNSSLMSYILSNIINSSLKGMSSHVTPNDIRRLPYERPNSVQHNNMETLVDDMLNALNSKSSAKKIAAIQSKINKIVYEIYSILAASQIIIENWFNARVRGL